MVNIEKVCVDKWLWSVWIFKLCIQAIDVCKLGKVQVNNMVVKFFQLIQQGDYLIVKKNGFNL